MKKIALTIMFITICSKIFGFSRDLILSYFFGTSYISDAYLISLTIPSVIFGFIGTAINTSYIPMQSRIIAEDGDERATTYTSNLVNLLLIFVTIIIIICLIFTEPIVKLFAVGFTGETLETAVLFTKIGLIGMYFTAMISVFRGYLQLKNNFVIPALIGFPLNFITILAIVIAAKGNFVILAIGTLLATISEFLFMVPSIGKEGYRYKFYLNFSDERIYETIKIGIPVIIGASVNQINTLLDRTIASTIEVGAISALNYASRLNLFIQGIFVTSLVTVLYPLISNYATQGNMKKLKSATLESINIISIFLVPITFGTMIFSREIIELLFGRGAFDETAVNMTSIALFYYAVGILGFGLRDILSRVFYALQDTKTPMTNATIGVVINIVLNLVFSRYMGVGGLALATSISALVTTTLLFYSLRKKFGSFGLKSVTMTLIKVFTASILMGIIAKISYLIWSKVTYSSISLVASVGTGAMIYFILIMFMKIEEIDTILNIFKNKVNRNKQINKE